jgi:hypothetical protein
VKDGEKVRVFLATFNAAMFGCRAPDHDNVIAQTEHGAN